MEICECGAILLDFEIEHCGGYCSDCCEENHINDQNICFEQECLYFNECNSLKYEDPCPKCKTQLVDASGGGVKCPNKNCDYWFCY